MRVAPDFLAPLLEGFRDPHGFRRLLPDLLQRPRQGPRGNRPDARLVAGRRPARAPPHRPGHRRTSSRASTAAAAPAPSTAAKFLELGGFDELLAPFYLEDTDLGYMAWKRGWKVLYQPRSVVYHEHRGTIGKRFSEEQIQAVLKKNFLLFCWKNIHEWPRLASHFAFAWAGAVLSRHLRRCPGRPNLRGALARVPAVAAAPCGRAGAPAALAAITDTEAFRRPLGGYFRDRFAADGAAPRNGCACCSSRPIPSARPCTAAASSCTRRCARWRAWPKCTWSDCWIGPGRTPDNAGAAPVLRLRRMAGARPGPRRRLGSLLPHAVREFANHDFEWLIHRQMYLKHIDVLQLEYTPLAQYGGDFRRIATALFEHDVYFQSDRRAALAT